MAKKKQTGKKPSGGRKKLPEVYNKLLKVGAYDNTHRKQLQQRAKKVQQLYKQAVDKIARAAAPSLFNADPAKEFHFSDFPALNKSVEALIDDMGKQLQANIEDGDSDAWTLANAKNDMVVNTLATVYNLPKETLKAWRHPHLDALQQFEERRKAGMNLSNGGSEKDLRKGVWNLDQFKNELELALEQGIGQGKSAVDLSRDVRQYLKYPNKLFRRVRDKDGNLRLSKAAAAFHPGRGVYRSSYKNALRLTATENNIAYRTCDHKRWNALPFVIGQEIKTSNNHPTDDICDTLAGKYPIEFKFTGWHPFCRCYAVSILASEKELDDYCSKLEQGTNVSEYQFTGKQTQMPEAFTTWMKDNEQRIANAKSLPYFIKDNYKDGDPAKGLRWTGKKETAKQRILRKAAERHAARTQADKDAILKRLQAREQKHQQMRDTAQLAMEQIKEMPEVSEKQLAKYIKDGDLDRMYKLALKKINEVNAMKAKEQALEDLIPNVHDWHKKFKIKELEAAHDAVRAKLDSWAGFDKAKLKKKLEFEVDYIENHPKYITDDVAKAAYSKKLDTVKFEIKADDLDKQLNDFYAYKTKSQAFQDLLGKAGYQLSLLTEENQATQIPIVEKKLKQLEYKKNQLEAAKAKRKTKTKFTQDRKDKAVWDDGGGNPDKVGAKADKVLRPQASKTWKNAPQEQRDMMYEYTYHYADKNEPLELRAYHNNQTRKEWERKVNLMTDYIDNSPLPKDMWFQRGDDVGALEGRLKFVGGKMPKHFNDLVGMELQEGGFMSVGSGKWKGFNEDCGKDVIFNIFAPKGTKAAYVEPFSEYGSGVCSSSWNGIDKQTDFSQEFETIFQRGTRMRITKVERKMYQGRIITYIDVEVIGQEKKALDYVPDNLIGW